ncbi:MAG: insulinase family protein [Clostridia bacterium]|nr:insulinase family protein [Clostridia bacterium]
MDNIQIINFNGGGTLIYQNSTRNKATSVLVGFGVGTVSNTQNGIAHFTEHMLFKGTGKRSKEQLENDLRDYCGNSFNAFTGLDYTVFAFNRVNTLLDNAFELASDILLNSSINKRIVDNERSVILEEYNMSEDTAKYNIDVEHHNIIFNRNFDNRISIGNKEDLDKITAKSITEFKKKFYVRENFVISVVGSEKLSKIKKLVKKYFLNNLPISEKPNKVEHNVKVVQESGYQILKKETDNVLVNISLKSVGYNDVVRSSVTKIINEYLSGGVDGKLFKAVRDKGLAYVIYTDREMFKENGTFNITFESTKENVNKVIDEIGKVINDIRKNGIEESEIQKTKNNFIYYMSEIDVTNFKKALSNLDKFIIGKPYIDKEYTNRLLGTTKEVVDEYFVDLFDTSTPIYVTIGGKVKQGEVYSFDEIKNKLLK